MCIDIYSTHVQQRDDIGLKIKFFCLFVNFYRCVLHLSVIGHFFLVLRSFLFSVLSLFSPQYVTKTVEVESTQCKQALMEAQARNQALQEQLVVQRELLRELEQQLHESQRTSSHLRQQVWHIIRKIASSLRSSQKDEGLRN